MDEDDLVAAGFERLDANLIERRPPKIQWGQLYQEMNDADKIHYLENLASTMNHAARLVQEERNQLSELCAKKEEQLTQINIAMNKNTEMLQSEVTKMNEQRQSFNAEVERLNGIIKDTERGNIH